MSRTKKKSQSRRRNLGSATNP